MSTHEELREEAEDRERDMAEGWRPFEDITLMGLIGQIVEQTNTMTEDMLKVGMLNTHPTRTKPGIEAGSIEDEDPDHDN